MSFVKKSFDFSGKMNDNKNFYIFKTTSTKDSSEIISKLEKYEKTYDFFKHYTNNDIKSAFILLENLDNIYSYLYSENYKNNFNSKIDIYISALSHLYLLSNLITKNKLIINKAIDKLKNNLETFYIENAIDNSIQKKLNNYIINTNGIQLIEEKKSKKKMPILLLNNNFKSLKIEKVDSIILYGKILKIKNTDCSINNTSLNQEKTRDITDQTINNINNNSKIIEDNYILDIRTPSFPKKIGDSYPSGNAISQQVINDSINDNASKKESIKSFCIKDNDVNKNYFKKGSIHSLYTLASKSKFHEEKIRAVSSKFKGIAQEESNSNNNINIKINSSINVKKNSKFLISSRKINTNINNKDEDKMEIKNTYKKQSLSSTELKPSIIKMYKDLLILINNLFKKEIINFEEKIQLKELIIIKSEKLDNIYANYYPNNKDTLIAQLKKLIH